MTIRYSSALLMPYAGDTRCRPLRWKDGQDELDEASIAQLCEEIPIKLSANQPTVARGVLVEVSALAVIGVIERLCCRVLGRVVALTVGHVEGAVSHGYEVIGHAFQSERASRPGTGFLGVDEQVLVPDDLCPRAHRQEVVCHRVPIVDGGGVALVRKSVMTTESYDDRGIKELGPASSAAHML